MAWFRPSVPCIRAEQWRARWSSNAWVGSGSERFAGEEFDGGRWVFAATTQLSWPELLLMPGTGTLSPGTCPSTYLAAALDRTRHGTSSDCGTAREQDVRM